MKSSKAGVLFLLLFAIPFIGMGSALVWKMLFTEDGGQAAIAGAVFGFGFVLVGLLIAGATIFGYAKLRQTAAAKELNPNSPWLWRKDWAQNRCQGQSRNVAAFLWIVTLVVSCLTLPWIFMASAPPRKFNGPPQVFIFGMASFALVLAIIAIRATIRRERFGKTFFEFDALPNEPGHRVSGRICVRLGSALPEIGLRLSCVRRITTNTGNNRSTRNEILWEEEQTIAAGALLPNIDSTLVPISFDIPAQMPQSSAESSNDCIVWLLRAEARTSGVRFSEIYELPVFASTATASSSDRRVFGFGVSPFLSDSSASQGTEKLERPVKISAQISSGVNGTEIYFHPLRNPGLTLAQFLCTVVWNGTLYALYSKSVWILAAIFSLADLLLIYGLLTSLFSRTRIQLSGTALTLRKSMLGLSRNRNVPFAAIAAIVAVSSGQQSLNGTAWHTLRLIRKDGSKLTLATGIASRQEARWLVSQMESLAGLKQDTQVRFDDLVARAAMT